MTRPPPPDIPLQADERTMLLAYLTYHQAALLDRAHGLTREQLSVGHPPTTLTLPRILGHMALVEYIWFQNRFDGGEVPEPFASLDWEADVDAEMTMAEGWSVEELHHQFATAVADSRARIDAAASLDQVSVVANQEGDHWSLRWILIHMIEEYARHCGHADLIREAIDGDVVA